MSRSLGGGEDGKLKVEGGVHEPERPHSAAVIKGKRRDLRAVASVARVASSEAAGRDGRNREGGEGWGSGLGPHQHLSARQTAARQKGRTQKYRELHRDEHLTVRGDLPPPAHPDEIIPSPNCNQSSEKHSGAAAHSAINSPGPGVLLFKYYNPFNVLPAYLFLLH